MTAAEKIKGVDMGRLAANGMMVRQLQSALSHADSNARTIPMLVKNLDRDDAWQIYVFPDSIGMDPVQWTKKQFRDFIETPRPKGCGTPIGLPLPRCHPLRPRGFHPIAPSPPPAELRTRVQAGQQRLLCRPSAGQAPAGSVGAGPGRRTLGPRRDGRGRLHRKVHHHPRRARCRRPPVAPPFPGRSARPSHPRATDPFQGRDQLTPIPEIPHA
jgi:hypothetical protein